MLVNGMRPKRMVSGKIVATAYGIARAIGCHRQSLIAKKLLNEGAML
jgi:hypothetical protein